MEAHHNLPTSSCTLKVNIKDCSDCQEKAVKKLERMHGVDSVTYDTKEGLLRVSGNVDPVTLVNKFARWGKKAELCSFQKDSREAEQGKCNCCFCKNSVDSAKTKKQVSSDDQRTKKGKELFGLCGWFGKKNTKPTTSGSKFPPEKWPFPRNFMPEYGALGPPPFAGRQCPGCMSRYAPVVFPRPVSHHIGHGSMPLPLPLPPQPRPPYGYFQSKPSDAPPKMIHYTGYEDNNFYPWAA